MKLDMPADRTEKLVKGLLMKPSTKPNFSQVGPPSILSQIKGFLPVFKESTEMLLSDKEKLKDHVMEITGDAPPSSKFIEMVQYQHLPRVLEPWSGRF